MRAAWRLLVLAVPLADARRARKLKAPEKADIHTTLGQTADSYNLKGEEYLRGVQIVGVLDPDTNERLTYDRKSGTLKGQRYRKGVTWHVKRSGRKFAEGPNGERGPFKLRIMQMDPLGVLGYMQAEKKAEIDAYEYTSGPNRGKMFVQVSIPKPKRWWQWRPSLPQGLMGKGGESSE